MVLLNSFKRKAYIFKHPFGISTAKALGGSIEIAKFVRFEKGEGIEKRQDDFAAEVASMVK